MGVASLIGKAAKAGKGLFDDAVDYAGPLLTDNVTDMTAEQIEMAIQNADQLGLPSWRVHDLKVQLPKSLDLEEARSIRADADQRLNEISVQGRAANDPRPFVKGQDDPFEYIKSWLADEVFDPPPPVRREAYSGVDDFPYGEVPYRNVQPDIQIPDFNPSHYLSRAIRGSVWADPAEMKRAKELSRSLESATGVPMEVDHLIPLKGEYVSGLNNQDNLFVMPAVENRLKSNSFSYDEYASIPASSRRLTTPKNHAKFLGENKKLVEERQRKKAPLAREFSSHLNQQIVNPNTQLGRNARKLWGDDSEKYLEYYRNQLNLLGIPSK